MASGLASYRGRPQATDLLHVRRRGFASGAAFRALDEMRGRGYLEREGTGPAAVWYISPELKLRFTASTEWQMLKVRVLGALRESLMRGETGLGNREIREMTEINRNQVYRLMTELRGEVPQLEVVGTGRWAQYRYRPR